MPGISSLRIFWTTSGRVPRFSLLNLMRLLVRPDQGPAWGDGSPAPGVGIPGFVNPPSNNSGGGVPAGGGNAGGGNAGGGNAGGGNAGGGNAGGGNAGEGNAGEGNAGGLDDGVSASTNNPSGSNGA